MVQNLVLQTTPDYWGAQDKAETFLNLLGYKAGVIVLDAFDGEGKTTTAKFLMELTGYGYVHYPLNPQGYSTAEGYIREMIETLELLRGKIVDRLVYSTIAYNDIAGQEFNVARIMNFVKENGVLITSTPFWELLHFKLKKYPDLLDILHTTRVILFHPYIRFPPNWDDVLAHMHSQESINFVRTQLMVREMYR
jgi:hypothetical protein